MFDDTRNNLGLRRITRAWFWEDMLDAVSNFVRSRSAWVTVGSAGTFLTALAGSVYYWSRPLSFAGYAVIQLVCLVCQAVALIPVAWPGRAATPRDVADLSDFHQGLTVATVCGSWIFGVYPCAGLFIIFDVDVNSPPWFAVGISGSALMLACIAGGITATIVSEKVGTQLREAAEPPAVSDRADSGDSADVDSGGFDGD
jgi:hypothetical protein